MNDLVTVTMPVRIWSGTHAGLDNVVDLAVVNGYSTIESTGSSIQKAGLNQVPWTADGQWPPDDQLISITLTRPQWAFVHDMTVEELLIYEELQDDESATLCREAIVVLLAAGV